MKVYKADSNFNLLYFTGIVSLLSIIVFLLSGFTLTGVIFVVVIIIFFAVYNLFSSRIDEIQIDEINKTITLDYKNSFIITKTCKYNLSTIKFTYKKQATSFKSGIKNVCSIYNEEKRVAQLISGNDGWDDNEIFSFVHALISEGVEKKFVGYTLKDVEI